MPVGVVYSRVIMKDASVRKAGSRMIRWPFKASSSHLGRVAAVVGCVVFSAAVLGAAQAKPHKKPASLSHIKKADHSIKTAVSAHGEAEQVTLASAFLPGTGPHERVIWMEVTAYCGCTKCCGPHAHGLTASGRSISYNGGLFVAADTKLFKFGTKLEVPGYADGQPVEVIDRGGAIKGYHLDVFFPTHEQARQWGRKWLAVTIVE